MRIQSIASFYDASSRINGINRVSAVEANNVSEANQSSTTEKEQISNPSVGVKQTLVSAENAYQKQMLTDPDFAMKRMAGKLMDKLPKILEDIGNLSNTAATTEINKEVAPVAEPTTAKVIIGENSEVNFANNTATALQDISL